MILRKQQRKNCVDENNNHQKPNQFLNVNLKENF